MESTYYFIVSHFQILVTIPRHELPPCSWRELEFPTGRPTGLESTQEKNFSFPEGKVRSTRWRWLVRVFVKKKKNTKTRHPGWKRKKRSLEYFS